MYSACYSFVGQMSPNYGARKSTSTCLRKSTGASPTGATTVFTIHCNYVQGAVLEPMLRLTTDHYDFRVAIPVL